MKAKNLVATIVWIGVSLMAAQPVVAQDAAAQKAGPAAASATTCPWAGRMNAQMARMLAMHQAVANAGTPAERQKLMAEQRQLMQQSMSMMRQMPGGYMGGGMGRMGMQGGGMHGGMGMGMGGARGACMSQRVAMMELMMQSMMENPAPSSSAPTQ